MKSLAERVAIMQAYLEGKPVQYYTGKNWTDCTSDPAFSWHTSDYRVKPTEPQVLYQALCQNGADIYYITSAVYKDEAEAREDQRIHFIRLLTENPIAVEVPG
jgi:hypothetical protein